MTIHLSFRAELANQVFQSLAKLSDEEWQLAEARATIDAPYFGMAYALANQAVELLVEEFGEELGKLVELRLRDVDELFDDAERASEPIRWRLARSAMLAVFLRDSRGFNAGAFEQLFAPMSTIVDLASAERIAVAAATEGADDYMIRRREESGPTPTDTVRRRRA